MSNVSRGVYMTAQGTSEAPVHLASHCVASRLALSTVAGLTTDTRRTPDGASRGEAALSSFV